MAANDPVARVFGVAEKPTVSDKPAGEVAVVTGAELRASDGRPELDHVRDEPLADGTGRLLGLAKFRPPGPRTRPRSR